MKVKLTQLSLKDKAVLADLYESEQYKTFKKYFIDNGQIILAQQGVMGANWEAVNQARGAIVMLKSMHDEMQRNYQEEMKRRN